MNKLAPVRATVPRPYRVSLPAGPEAAVEARRHVWAIIHAWDIPIDAYAAALLASELVTDAMRQDTDGHEAVQLMISWVDGQFRVEVHEGSRVRIRRQSRRTRGPTPTPGAASRWSAMPGGVTCASGTGPSRPGKETDDNDGASPRDGGAPVPYLTARGPGRRGASPPPRRGDHPGLGRPRGRRTPRPSSPANWSPTRSGTPRMSTTPSSWWSAGPAACCGWRCTTARGRLRPGCTRCRTPKPGGA